MSSPIVNPDSARRVVVLVPCYNEAITIGKVVGDVDFASVEPVAGYLSPVPGGVGKMTICMLMENTVEAAERKAG